MKNYAFGVDIGGTSIKLGLFQTDGMLLESWEIPTRTEGGGENILPDIAKAVSRKLAEKGIAAEAIEGIGVDVPGPVRPDGTVLKCVNLGWGVFNVEERLSKLTGGLKCKAGNDANVAALGESWQGGGKGMENIVLVTLGTGIGGGVILGGKIFPGINGAAGEIGHMPMVAEEEEPDICGCGKCGCLEQYASARGIVRVARHYLEDHPEEASSLRGMDSFTAKEIFEEAEKGDAPALSIVEKSCHMLGRGLAAVACVLNPDSFVIGGGMSKAGSFLLEKLQKYFRRYAFHASRETGFKLAELGNDAGIYGAVRMVLE